MYKQCICSDNRVHVINCHTCRHPQKICQSYILYMVLQEPIHHCSLVWYCYGILRYPNVHRGVAN